MKHIDAEKLKAEIERELSAHDKVDHLEAFEVGKAWNRGHRKALENILSFIESLQQEQSEEPDKNLEKSARLYAIPHYMRDVDVNYLEEYPYDKIAEAAFIAGAKWMARQMKQEQSEPTCKTCGFYENNCPFIRGKLIPYPNKVCKDYTYSVIKEQEQQEVDLEEEIQMEWDSFNYHLAEYGDEREEVVWLNRNSFADIARDFYKLGKLSNKK